MYVTDVLKIKENDLLSKARAVRVNGHRYNSGTVVVLGITNDDYILGKIVLYFLKLRYFFSTQCFPQRAFLFITIHMTVLVKIVKLYEYHQLRCYKVKGIFYVLFRHYITPLSSLLY